MRKNRNMRLYSEKERLLTCVSLSSSSRAGGMLQHDPCIVLFYMITGHANRGQRVQPFEGSKE